MIPSAAANYKPHPWDLRGGGGADIIEGKGGDWMDLTSPVTALPGIAMEVVVTAVLLLAVGKADLYGHAP